MSIELTRRRLLLGAAGLAAAACSGRTTSSPDPDAPTALVIGSGFGGAVAALRLGLKGIRTTVLERGRRWPVVPAGGTFCNNLEPDGRSTWLRTQTIAPVGLVFEIDRYVGVLERRDFERMRVYAGAAVGGGSVVYGCMTVQPRRELFERVFPADVSYTEMDQVYYPRVRAMLSATSVPADLAALDIFLAARVFNDHGARAGLSAMAVELATDWSVLRGELDGTRVQSALAGELLYGANSGYKNSLDRNYLPAAEATGNVEVVPLHRAVAIRRDGAKYVVEAEQISEQGERLSQVEFTADMLFLAAGTMGTGRLLLKAQQAGTLANLDSRLGQGVGTNGNRMFIREGLQEETGVVQALPPVTAIPDLANPVTPLLVENAPFPVGYETNSLMHLGAALEEDRGHFEYDSAADDVQLVWPQGAGGLATGAVQSFVDRVAQHSGGQLGTMWVNGITNNFTYHPLGGAALGLVCDSYGRVKGQEKLYVVDGSLVPGSGACANPSLTIAALAERNMDRILAEDL